MKTLFAFFLAIAASSVLYIFATVLGSKGQDWQKPLAEENCPGGEVQFVALNEAQYAMFRVDKGVDCVMVARGNK